MITEKTWSTKFIAPLLVNNVIAFSQKNGFINAYTGDINKPYLTNHLFMLYKRTNDIVQYDTLVRIYERNEYYYCRYTYRIDNEFYYIFVLVRDVGRYKKDIKELINGNYHLVDYDTRIKIIVENSLPIKSKEHRMLFDLEVIPDNKINLLDEVIKEIDPPAVLQFKAELLAESLI